jgi:hypothetical protein
MSRSASTAVALGVFSGLILVGSVASYLSKDPMPLILSATTCAAIIPLLERGRTERTACCRRAAFSSLPASAPSAPASPPRA